MTVHCGTSGTLRRSRCTLARVVALAVAAFVRQPGLRAQRIVDEALRDFPAETVRLEYTNLASLRKLQNYDALRERYLAAGLKDLENSLAKLGIEESDLDELVLGWPGAKEGKLDAGGGLYGLAQGRFRTAEITDLAAARKVKPIPVGSVEAFCVSSSEQGPCLCSLDEVMGAFGSLKQLSAMVGAREGGDEGLSSNDLFARLTNGSRPDSPIWGVATDAAIGDWIRSSMPGQETMRQESMRFDSSLVLTGVEALTYSIDVTERVCIVLRFDCSSSASAGNLRQMLSGLEILQRMAWQSRNPNLPNPLEKLALESSGERVEVKVDALVPTP